MVDEVIDFAAAIADKRMPDKDPRNDANAQAWPWDVLIDKWERLADLTVKLGGQVVAIEQARQVDRARIGILEAQVRILIEMVRQGNGSRADAE